MKFGEPAPIEMVEWQMAERFGWTLDYINSLPMGRWHEYIQINDGMAKAKGHG